MQDMSASVSNSAGAAPSPSERPAAEEGTKGARVSLGIYSFAVPLFARPDLTNQIQDKSASASIFAGVYPPVARRRKVPQLGSLPLPTRDLDNTSSPLFSPPPLRRTSSAVTSTANLQAQLPQPQPQPQPKFPNKSKSPPGPVGNLKSKSTANKDAEVPVRGAFPSAAGAIVCTICTAISLRKGHRFPCPPPPPSDNATAGGGAQMQPVVEPSVSERILLRGEREREREGENTPILAEGSRPDVEMQDVSVDQNTANVAKPVGCSEVKAIKEEIAALSENVQPDLDSDDDLVLLYPQSSPVQPRSPTSRVSPPHPLLRSRSESPSDSDSDSSRSSSPPMLSLSTARFPSENPHARPPSPAVSKPHYMPGWDSSSPSQSTPPLPPPTSASSFASTSTTTSTATAVTSTAVSELSAPQSLVELAADPAFLTRLVDSWQELRTEVSALREELRSRAESESGDAAMTARLEERVRKLEGERGSASISQARPPAIPSRISESVSVALQFQSNAAAAGAPMHWHPLQHLIAGDGIEDGGDGNTQMFDVQRSAEGPRATATTQRGISGLGGPGFSGSEVLLPPRSRKFREGVRLGSV
ncbi:hypothetical protein MSAN_00252700 [Mycena sanguinolenta]|uniref:Uncharacterized protein n=1 Tax=Mycena sanguinolenta TaxID=230812 RepID=A0A8H6ZFY5_9AGAR|nr:hypothetical protein MSAN_00252700 [Mycena sanguinolenta]